MNCGAKVLNNFQTTKFNCKICLMRNYFLYLNCRIVADFYTYGRALNAFRRRMNKIDPNKDMLELFGADGHRYASSF